MPVSHFQSTGMFLSVLYSFLIAFCRKDFMIASLDYNHYNLLPEIYQVCFCLGLSKYSFLCLDAHLLWVLGTLLQLIQFHLQYHSYRGRHPIYTIISALYHLPLALFCFILLPSFKLRTYYVVYTFV